jgi:hypothetical protein
MTPSPRLSADNTNFRSMTLLCCPRNTLFYSSYRRKPVSTAEMGPDLRRDDRYLPAANLSDMIPGVRRTAGCEGLAAAGTAMRRRTRSYRDCPGFTGYGRSAEARYCAAKAPDSRLGPNALSRIYATAAGAAAPLPSRQMPRRNSGATQVYGANGVSAVADATVPRSGSCTTGSTTTDATPTVFMRSRSAARGERSMMRPRA